MEACILVSSSINLFGPAILSSQPALQHQQNLESCKRIANMPVAIHNSQKQARDKWYDVTFTSR